MAPKGLGPALDERQKEGKKRERQREN